MAIFSQLQYCRLLLCLAIPLTLVAVASAGSADRQQDLLPDIVIDQSWLYDWDISTDVVPGRTHLRVSNGTANVGDGPLHLFAVQPDNGDGTQDVMQRVFADDSSYYDRLAGRFVYHPDHGHIHFENWAIFRLREYLAGGGVGDIVSEGSKTSFCIVDLFLYDTTLTNYDPDGFYFSCGLDLQGLSVGWEDAYSKEQAGQNMDITDIPYGLYWLESEADPDNAILELDETNNISRILIVIGDTATAAPDTYEPNDSPAQVDSRPPGGPNSPNLGPCDPARIVTDLSIHEPGNDDYFKFYSNDTGTIDNYVRIQFQHGLGDLNLALLDSSLTEIAVSQTTTDEERISLDGVPEGWYYLHVYGANSDTNSYYNITVVPPSNDPPTISLIAPPAGDTVLYHGFDTYPVTWTYSDPEDNDCWVSIYCNSVPQLDGNELLLPTSLYTEAEQLFYILFTEYLDHGTYYVYAEITDGGTSVGTWSDGTITITEPPPVDAFAGRVTDSAANPIPGVAITIVGETQGDTSDVVGDYLIPPLEFGTYDISFSHDYYRDTIVTGKTVNPFGTTTLNMVMIFECPYLPGDISGDGTGPNVDDLTYLVAFLFSGGPPPPIVNAANVDGAGEAVDVSDLTYLVSFLFQGGSEPQCP